MSFINTKLSECEISISGSSSSTSSDDEAQSDAENSLEENDIDEETMSLENDVEHNSALESSTLEEGLLDRAAQGGAGASSAGSNSEGVLTSLDGQRGVEILQTLRDEEAMLLQLLDIQDRPAGAGDSLWGFLPRPPYKIKSGESC